MDRGVSHSGGSSSTPCRFMLQKPKLNIGTDGCVLSPITKRLTYLPRPPPPPPQKKKRNPVLAPPAPNSLPLLTELVLRNICRLHISRLNSWFDK